MTSPVVGAGEQSAGAALENLHLGGYVLPAQALARWACGVTPVIGKSMLLGREALDAVREPAVGMRVQVKGRDGEAMLATVRELDDEGVVLDANHPLAGQVLNFTIAIVTVREPTEAELAARAAAVDPA